MKLSYLQDNDIELTDFLLDARDLVTKYQTSISQSAYQIYLCMHLERGQSSIADHYRSNAVSDIKIERFGNRPIKGHTDWVHSVSFSPDGKHVASGSKDRTIRIWEAANENCIACPFDGHTNFSRFAAYKSEATGVTSGLNVETA